MDRELRPKPVFTVDVVVLTNRDPRSVLLIQRAHAPFEGLWALPGGHVEVGERAVAAASREVREETGLDVEHLLLVGLYDEPGRDPRGWTVSAAFALEIPREVDVIGQDDAVEAKWFPVDQLPELAFDHAVILEDAEMRLDNS